MARTVAETIRDTTREHLENKRGKLFGQCVTAVGWVGGTIPEMTEEEGIVELALSDSSNPGMAVGAALAGTRPIYVIRYQGFLWYNAPTLVNYAAKSKEMWGVPCPVFIRAIAMEGGIGPVATSAEYSMVMRKPGMPVFAPMTPGEWTDVWNYYMEHDDPVFCSEHRKSFGIDNNILEYSLKPENPDITLFGISAGRLSIAEALFDLQEDHKIACDTFPIVQLKPFKIKDEYIESLQKTGLGLIVDSDNEIAGASTYLAHQLMLSSGVPVHVLGVKDRTAGFAPHLDNGTPTADDVYDEIVCLVAEKNIV